MIQPWRGAEAGPRGSAPLIFVFASLLLASVGAIWLFAEEFAAPIRVLERQALRLGRGELELPIAITETGELGALATALETSRRQLKQTLGEVRELNASLELRVRERTASLEQALLALASAQEQVVGAEKLASLGRLSAGIAHEVNNPLNFVKNALPPLEEGLARVSAILAAARFPSTGSEAELARAARDLQAKLERGELEVEVAELSEMVRVMDHGVDRMARILGALLDFSRQGPEGTPERFDLAAAIDSALALLRHDLRDRVRVAVELGAVRTLFGHPGPLGQVLINLIKNAAEAIEGRGSISITARLVSDDGQVELAIADSGKGMSPEVVARLFEPFFTTKAVGHGTGLGMAMVHGIVQKHGGTVRVSSSAGAGTTVTVALPQPLEPAPPERSDPGPPAR